MSKNGAAWEWRSHIKAIRTELATSLNASQARKLCLALADVVGEAGRRATVLKREQDRARHEKNKNGAPKTRNQIKHEQMLRELIREEVQAAARSERA